MPDLSLHPDRLFPADHATRVLAREFYGAVADLPIISPHGHCDPAWFAEDAAFPNPSDLLIKPDHYVFRMLHSAGVPLEDLGIEALDGSKVEADPRIIWRRFAEHYHLFRGTPSRLWLDHVFAKVFHIERRLTADTADLYYDAIEAALATPAFRPRALFERFNIKVLATTEDPLDPLEHHAAIRQSGWGGRVITAFRPDNVLDPDQPNFRADLARLSEITGEDALSYTGYLRALENRRAFFRAAGATSTDHGHPTAATFDLEPHEAETLFARVVRDAARRPPATAELFRGHMLMQMARMSLDDGMVMQIHPGVTRNHDAAILHRFGRDKGADVPTTTEYVQALKPLLNRYGADPRLSLIVFTLDETAYSRELAPLAGHYPAMKLGPPWWFHDSPEGMRRFREQATETAGFYNTVGFNDDTRAFLSIPARHDVARRMDAAFLARMVVEHRLGRDEAHELARGLAYDFAKAAYKL
jgi:glucuronate isomerase